MVTFSGVFIPLDRPSEIFPADGSLLFVIEVILLDRYAICDFFGVTAKGLAMALRCSSIWLLE